MKKCVFCGGRLETKIVTFTHEVNGQVIIVKNVPAESCGDCGEKTYSPQVTDELLAFAEKKHNPVELVKVPVYDFAA